MAKEKLVWHLTTPLMHEARIKRLQVLLKEKGYLAHNAPVDGIYGLHTAQAVFRAKFWLGYLKPNQSAGELLTKFLSGDRKPTIGMKLLVSKRKAARRRAAKKHKGLTKGQAVLRKACSQLGETEHPKDSNRSKFSLWYGIIGAWCAMFCTWCSVNTIKAFVKGQRYAYVPYVRNDAMAGRNGLSLTTAPRSGSYVIYDWNGDHIGDHIGIFAEEADLKTFIPKAFAASKKRFGALGKGEFWAVEGNTGVGNDSNGGEVMIRKRSLKDVQSFINGS